MPTIRSILLLLVLSCLPLASSAEEKRIALLIGNQDYPPEVGVLSNTHKDVETIDSALRDVGFETMPMLDLDEDQMEDAFDQLEAKIYSEASAGNEVVVFFYYSGHGAAAYEDQQAKNFLIPARESIKLPSHIFRKGIELEEVLASLQISPAKAVFVVSDACRNELKFSFSKSVANKGWSVVPQRPGMLVAFATAPGETTPDDGLFAQTLAAEIRRPGQDAVVAFYQALAEVSEARRSTGRPFMAPGKLPRGLCFAGCNKPPVVADEDTRDWERLSVLDKEEGYRIYLALHPNGQFTSRANAAIERLGADTTGLTGTLAPPQSTASTKELYDRGTTAYFSEDYATAADLYQEACDLGEPRGCTDLGYIFEAGLNGTSNLSKARSLYKQGCDGGNAHGCSNLGYLMEAGIGGPVDFTSAQDLYRRGCEGGNPRGCANLGVLFEHGRGIQKNLQSARNYYKQACEGDNAIGCTNLGYLFETGGGGVQDKAVARGYYEQGCDGGNGIGCINLGTFYEFGIGGPEDKSYARELYEFGCDAGEPRGCKNLGWLMESGIGGPKDEVRARELYQLGCIGGYAEACTNLGYLSEMGIGGDQDKTRARTLYNDGCEGGSSVGCSNLGYLMENGIGGAVDHNRARTLYKKGCDTGDARGCNNYGIALINGIGGSRNKTSGLSYVRNACSDGFEWSCNWLDDNGYSR